MILQVQKVLKLLESPYEVPDLRPVKTVNVESESDVRQQLLHIKAESGEALAEKQDTQVTSEMTDHYFSKPPEWSLNLCVT